ncbi:kynureninase [Homoserinibacter sp. YIM 151385]|uniref:kynureninase n=1 Tax=Homoserinibacter sp. YIM 151385 TaxID=2985506 RepID=UPI0022F0FA49|nr:aminotransferase class V-fold PLP-dependent enzyme [Homoserinibacter sp. YIM 151385]WBU38334.1 aminotransferase class V-fold PLP-dependent enzyme [Homoserinibacter sp. YIM 151385]
MTEARTPTAAELDAADPLASLRERFIDPGSARLTAYLDGNSLGRPLRATLERMPRFIAEEWGGRLIRGWDEGWLELPLVLGDRIGEVALGAAAGQTVVADSTSVLLYKLVRAALALRPDRDELVLSRDDFPTDRAVLEGIAAETGARLVWISPPADGGPSTELIAPALGPRTAAVVLSHVAYRSGHLADAAAITSLAHEAGALMLWDLCHSAGVVPIELDAWGVDLAVGCTYKHLGGGPGSPAFAYVAARHLDALRQPITGWMGDAAPFDMTEPYRPAPGIRRLLSGTPPVLAMQPLRDAVELVAEAGLPAIRQKSEALTAFALSLVEARLAPLGAELGSPRDAAQRGAHLTIEHPAARRAVATLWGEGVIPDFRPPGGIRIGLSPLSTSFAEVEAGVAAIERALTRG